MNPLGAILVAALGWATLACSTTSNKMPGANAGNPAAGNPAGGGGGDASGGAPPLGFGGAPQQDGTCGLESVAFCETFEGGPSRVRGRAGDLDPARFSASRMAPQNLSGGNKAYWVGKATIPTCRAGVGSTVLPPDDTLVCDGTADIRSSHLLTAIAAQNYGINSYRIRQLFDFSGRTGTVTFDVDATMPNGGWGWASLEITEEPIPTPDYLDFEYGSLPKNGLEIQMDFGACPKKGDTSVGRVLVYRDYVLTEVANSKGEPPCFATKQGALNRIRVRVSESRVEVLATDVSADGLTFPEPRVLFAEDVRLPLKRGYVSISGHNHATIKYGGPDAWVLRWDNVGFDGPVIGGREYSIPDANTPASNDGMEGINLGYKVTEGDSAMSTCCPDKQAGPLVFEDVDLTDVARATLAFSSFYLTQATDYTAYTLRYRFNGGEYLDRPLTEGEIRAIKTKGHLGAFSQTIDVPISLLSQGKNTLEFSSSGISQQYPIVVANIDLILSR